MVNAEGYNYDEFLSDSSDDYPKYEDLINLKENKMIEGSSITKVRPMYKGEYYREGWDNDSRNPVYVIELNNGCHLFASRDYEGNGGGALFGYDGKANKGFTITDNPAFVTPIKADTSKMNNEEFGEYIKNC